jgi:hypothetical protein
MEQLMVLAAAFLYKNGNQSDTGDSLYAELEISIRFEKFYPRKFCRRKRLHWSSSKLTWTTLAFATLMPLPTPQQVRAVLPYLL